MPPSREDHVIALEINNTPSGHPSRRQSMGKTLPNAAPPPSVNQICMSVTSTWGTPTGQSLGLRRGTTGPPQIVKVSHDLEEVFRDHRLRTLSETVTWSPSAPGKDQLCDPLDATLHPSLNTDWAPHLPFRAMTMWSGSRHHAVTRCHGTEGNVQ